MSSQLLGWRQLRQARRQRRRQLRAYIFAAKRPWLQHGYHRERAVSQCQSNRLTQLPTRTAGDWVIGWKTAMLGVHTTHAGRVLVPDADYPDDRTLDLPGPVSTTHRLVLRPITAGANRWYKPSTAAHFSHGDVLTNRYEGFHAFSTASGALRYHRSPAILMRVGLGGKVVGYENGYRAEYQKVGNIWCFPTCYVCDPLAQRNLPRTTVVMTTYDGNLVPMCFAHARIGKHRRSFTIGELSHLLDVDVDWYDSDDFVL